MGTTPSKLSGGDAYTQIEEQAVRSAIPRNLEDEHSRKLKHQLHMCVMKNDWYFTAGGLVLGSLLTYFVRSIKPIAAAAVFSPALDWAYGQHVCKECKDEYTEYRKQLLAHYKEQADMIRQQMRETQ